MALPISLLVAVERMKREENVLLRRYQRMHSSIIDTALLDAAVEQVAVDRIAFAKEFLASAKGLIAGKPAEIDLRNASSRAYYAVHHTLRAVLLYDLKADVYGHRESIEELTDLVKSSPALRVKASAAGITKTNLDDILDWRHLADYHVYGAWDPFEAPVDFSVIAPRAVVFSDGVVTKMEEYLRDRIAGLY